MGRRSCSHSSCLRRISLCSSRSRSRSSAARSKSWSRIASSFCASSSSSRLEVGHLRRRHLRRQPRARARLVDHVDRLVRQEAVRDVALRQLRRRLQRLVRDDHLVVVLVVLAQTLQDLDRSPRPTAGRRSTVWKRRSSAPSFSMYLRYSFSVRGADALQLAAGQRRLQHVRRVDRALRGARADQRVQLVDEEDDVLVLGDLVHDRLEPLLELAAVLRPGDHRRHVEREHAVVPQAVRALALGDELRQPFDDRRLADARLADQHRVVLLAAAQDLHDALDLLGAADRRVQLARAGRAPSGHGRNDRAPASWSSSRPSARRAAAAAGARRLRLRHRCPAASASARAPPRG